MASTVIHLAIAKEVNKRFKKDESKYLIGSIAPDIAKLIGEPKTKSHFITDESSIPNLELFLSKYQKNLNDDFVLGYYIHLLGDYFWFKYFIPEIQKNDILTTLDGKDVKLTDNMLLKYIYNDYTNLNIELIDKYNMDLKIFYNKVPDMDNIIKEIPMDKLNILLDQMGNIIENSKKKKAYVFNLNHIERFITTSVKMILAHLEELGL